MEKSQRRIPIKSELLFHVRVRPAHFIQRTRPTWALLFHSPHIHVREVLRLETWAVVTGRSRYHTRRRMCAGRSISLSLFKWRLVIASRNEVIFPFLVLILPQEIANISIIRVILALAHLEPYYWFPGYSSLLCDR